MEKRISCAGIVDFQLRFPMSLSLLCFASSPHWRSGGHGVNRLALQTCAGHRSSLICFCSVDEALHSSSDCHRLCLRLGMHKAGWAGREGYYLYVVDRACIYTLRAQHMCHPDYRHQMPHTQDAHITHFKVWLVAVYSVLLRFRVHVFIVLVCFAVVIGGPGRSKSQGMCALFRS